MRRKNYGLVFAVDRTLFEHPRRDGADLHRALPVLTALSPGIQAPPAPRAGCRRHQHFWTDRDFRIESKSYQRLRLP